MTADRNSISALLAAASSATAAATDMIETARDGEITPFSNVGSGETEVVLADSLRLLLEATSDDRADDDEANQLLGALQKFLEDRNDET